MAEKMQERVQRADRRRDSEEGPPPAANPETVEKGKQIRAEADKVTEVVDEALREGTADPVDQLVAEVDAALNPFAEEFVRNYVQQGGE